MKRLLYLVPVLLLAACGKKDDPKPLHSVRLECDSNTTAVALTITLTSSNTAANYSTGILPTRPVRRDIGQLAEGETINLLMNSGVRRGDTWPAGAIITGRILIDGQEKGRCQLPTTTYNDRNNNMYAEVNLTVGK